MSTSAPWPPPPDLDSMRTLLREADIEGLIAVHSAPPDEYDHEAALLHKAIGSFSSVEIVTPAVLAILEGIWQKSFDVEGEELTRRRPALFQLAAQVERFFGAAKTSQPPLARP